MRSIFSINQYTFPYKDLKFPGQHSEEKILFITRESKIARNTKLTGIILGTAILIILTQIVGSTIIKEVIPAALPLYTLITLSASITFALIALWWTHTLWRKSVFILTTRRLTKFIHTTPWNRYNLSLGLDKIVDTGAYQKGLLQAFTGLGYFVARSSAGNIKNFFVYNIRFAEDLHHYVNKLLYTFNDKRNELDDFRPFIPHLKGQKRIDFVKKTAPEYYQDRE